MKHFKWNEDVTKMVLSLVLFVLSLFIKDYAFILLLASYICISYEIYIHAFKNLLKGEIFDENLLMILATIGAFVIGKTEEAVMVIFLFEVGEYLSELATDRSKESIMELMDLRSDTAHIEKDGKLVEVDAKEVPVGAIIEVKPGEKIPLDGIVVEGTSFLDTKALTGESVPRSVSKNDAVLSGFINQESMLRIKTTCVFEKSTASKIMELMEKASEKKTKIEKFITRFSRIYTPVVVLIAVLLMTIPPLLGYPFETWLYRSLVFLVISCPCALVISVPLGFFCGIGRASKEGILIKGSHELDRLSHIETICFDKTGTITEGKFEVTSIENFQNYTKEEILKIAAYAEYYSVHPIGKSIVKKYTEEIDKKEIDSFKDIGGKGIEVAIFGKKYLIGNEKLMEENEIAFQKTNQMGSPVYLATEGNHIGTVIVSDTIKKNASKMIAALKQLGINRTVMISGDTKEFAQAVSERVGIKEYYADMLPVDKAQKVESLKKESVLAFVGDGLNDAPVIELADIGIAMGGIGSDATIEAADVVLMYDDVYKVVDAIQISKKTNQIVRFNIIFALIIKISFMILGFFGFTSVWAAVFADVGVTLLSVLNALRVMKVKITK
ncbi:MAG: heavy metal translocating P-type ATPase [Bacilli bacterium]|nr:heavy metal translocating P-type ATPase [Bacilli bacterium]